jgi:hypothetical protein
MDTYSPAAIDMAPATSPATAAIKTLFRVAAAAVTPTIRLAVERMPSLAPSTAARNQPMRLTKWLTGKAEAGSSEIPPVRLKPTHKNQHDEDNQDDADDTDASVTVAVAVTAEPAAEAAQQEDDEDDDKDESHDFISFGMT